MMVALRRVASLRANSFVRREGISLNFPSIEALSQREHKAE